MMPFPRFFVIALLASGLATLFCHGAVAEPLDKDLCSSLKSERDRMLTRDIKAALERGPDWVKDNLQSGLIEQVRAFLGVEEKLAFRCRTNSVAIPKPKLVPIPDRKPSLEAKAPEAASQTVAGAETIPEEGAGSGDDVISAKAPTGRPSQTVADSDKTAPSQSKSTAQ
ncbi:MAG: hypothetical protein ACREDO_10300 [Methyloceanibacter sp.]